MPESWRSRMQRWVFNFFPTYRSTGAWITYIADDFREIRIRLPLGWRTRNYVGTMFGGSMYAAGDGVFMVMLIKAPGPDYIVWDKSATVRFRKPARTKSRSWIERVPYTQKSNGPFTSGDATRLPPRASTAPRTSSPRKANHAP